MEDDMGSKASETNQHHDHEDLSEMLGELRILLPSAQLLNAFMILLPFNTAFSRIAREEKWAFLAIFLCSLTSLVLFSAPAIQHRLMRPLQNRARFKIFATRQILLGALILSIALVLTTHLVTTQVFGHPFDILPTLFATSVVAIVWWFVPFIMRARF